MSKLSPLFLEKSEHDKLSMSGIRQLYLDHNFLASELLSSRERQDFIDGNCVLREYEGQVIVDYTQKWGNQ